MDTGPKLTLIQKGLKNHHGTLLEWGYIGAGKSWSPGRSLAHMDSLEPWAHPIVSYPIPE